MTTYPEHANLSILRGCYIFRHEDTKPRRRNNCSSCVLRVFVTSWLHFWWVHFVGWERVLFLRHAPRQRRQREDRHEEKMMYITNRHLSRRTVLKGMGATVALPLLEAMVPARRALAATAAGRKVRLVAIEMVHGSAGSTAIGIKKNLWAPAAIGGEFDLGPTSLVSLEPFRDYLTI